jgi:hypothetical protein
MTLDDAVLIRKLLKILNSAHKAEPSIIVESVYKHAITVLDTLITDINSGKVFGAPTSTIEAQKIQRDFDALSLHHNNKVAVLNAQLSEQKVHIEENQRRIKAIRNILKAAKAIL